PLSDLGQGGRHLGTTLGHHGEIVEVIQELSVSLVVDDVAVGRGRGFSWWDLQLKVYQEERIQWTLAECRAAGWVHNGLTRLCSYERSLLLGPAPPIFPGAPPAASCSGHGPKLLSDVRYIGRKRSTPPPPPRPPATASPSRTPPPSARSPRSPGSCR